MKTSTLTIAGQQFVLAFDFNRLVEAERASGCNLLMTVNHLDLAGVAQLRALLYGLLLSHHEKMTLEATGVLFTPESLPLIARAIAELFPDPEDEEPVADAHDPQVS